jgi:PAS domain S-box-containing protein
MNTISDQDSPDTLDLQVRTVLLIDDEPANLAVLSVYLEGAGLHVLVARDGESGLDQARYAQPDLILLDVSLPGMDGFEICRCLKAEADTAAIPVLFMTARTEAADKLAGFAAGGVDYITKPFEEQEALARVTAHLRLRQLTHRLEAQNLELRAAQAALRQANEDLEWRVQERTAELVTANQDLLAQIAERQQAEAALRRERDLVARIMDTSPAGIVVVNREGQISFANPRAEHLLGLTHDQITARMYNAPEWRVTDYQGNAFPDEDLPFQQVMRTGQPIYDVCHAIEWPDGQRVLLAINAAPLVDAAGKVDGMVAAVDDITARVQADEELKRHRDHLEELVNERTAELAVAKEQAEVANQAKSAFLASISHELRTPLNGILGYAEILTRAGGLTSRQADGLHIMRQSGEHLLSLINDVLDLTKIEAGKLDLAPTDLHFPSFLQDLVGFCSMRAEQKGLTFVYQAAPDLPVGIRVDEKRVRQVLLNVLGNAIKFTAHGSVTLRVTTTDHRPPTTDHREDKQTRRQGDREITEGVQSVSLSPPLPVSWSGASSVIRFEVVDTGIGISPAELATIFRPFEQAGDPRQRAEGTGLGLAISQRLLQQMNSTLQVESELGKGSSFCFDLLVPVVGGTLEAARSSDRPILGYAGPRQTILVADDSVYNRSILVDLLTPLGFTVVEAADGPAVLEHVRALRPDVILMDLLMPGMTGTEAVQAIRQLEATPEIVIIATSASVLDTNRQQSMLAGCDAFLPKPIRVEQLMEVLASRLRLTWHYAAAEPHATAPADPDDTARYVSPPPAELALLFELASIGDILGLQARAAYLEDLDPQLRPFAQQLGRFAGRFELERALTLIARYLQPEE